MTDEDIVNFLARVGESALWTLFILLVLLLIVTSRADKE